MDSFLDLLRSLTPLTAAAVFLVENALLVAIAIGLGVGIIRWSGRKPLVVVDRGEQGERDRRLELVLVGTTIVANTVVTFVGWWLWRQDIVHIDAGIGPKVVVDLVVLVFVMDLLMYLGHRVAHHRLVYPIVHRMHHRFVAPRPATLFALHPLEVMGFGALWIGALIVYPFAALAIAGYGVVNGVFGTLGHLGVEPFPVRWRRRGVFRWVTTPTFHAGHHRDGTTNLGFYTTIWDRTLGTIDPSYDLARDGVTASVGTTDG